MISNPLSAAINHLLAREAWARERLIPYSGKTVRLTCPPIVSIMLVQPDGYVAAVEECPQCDVTIAAQPDALSAFLTGGQAAAFKHIRIEGDVEFASQIAKLAEYLRWEPEEDLAKIIGDAPAYRVMGLLRGAGEQVRRTMRNVRDSVAEYLLDENPQLVRRAALADFNAELSRARDALARIEKRITRVEQRLHDMRS